MVHRIPFGSRFLGSTVRHEANEGVDARVQSKSFWKGCGARLMVADLAAS